MEEEAREEQLRDRQDGRVYPVGRALRATYDADNHDTLGKDVTGLMIDLSKVPYGADDIAAGQRAAMRPSSSTEPFASPPPPRSSLLARLSVLFGIRPPGRT